MELKIKASNWSAGFPVCILNEKTSEKIGVHAGDRINIKTKSKEISSIIDTSFKGVGLDEIEISNEIKTRMNLKPGQKVSVNIAPPPESVVHIKKKLIGKKLDNKEIRCIIQDVVKNNLSQPEIAMFISAMYDKGMDFNETVSLVEAISETGKKMSFRNKYVVDKHCIGGIAGNRTTPIVVSICAAAGLIFPKTSSRAITSAAGTADTIEVLSPVEFEMDKLKKIVQKTNGCLAWGGGLGMVPADSKIIKIEKILKIDPTSQLLASIISKKLASGSKYVLIDIPYGKNAKVSRFKGIILKRKFEKLGKHFGLKMRVVLTSAREPIGRGVGPALEIKDVINVLNPKQKGEEDLKNKSIFLAGEIFESVGITKKGRDMAREILESGKAFEKFKEIIEAQGGKIKEIENSAIKKNIFSSKNGRVVEIHNKKINDLARISGCPVDKFAGVYLHKKTRERVKKGELLLTIYAESKNRLREAEKYYHCSKPIKIR